MKDFLSVPAEEIINEAFSTSTVLDVTEIRALYYGRIDVFASFNGDGVLVKEGSSSDKLRPSGVVCHTIADIVGKKVTSNEFYASVFRVKKSKSSMRFIDDIREYDYKMLEKDIDTIAGLDYISDDAKTYYIKRIQSQSKLRNAFAKLWELTKNLAETKGNYASRYWRKIFIDLGYIGFSDPHGVGLIVAKKRPATIVFEYSAIEMFDIVPIQKRNREKRSRIVNQIERDVKRMATARNRVAKYDFTTRKADGMGFFDKINQLLGD